MENLGRISGLRDLLANKEVKKVSAPRQFTLSEHFDQLSVFDAVRDDPGLSAKIKTYTQHYKRAVFFLTDSHGQDVSAKALLDAMQGSKESYELLLSKVMVHLHHAPERPSLFELEQAIGCSWVYFLNPLLTDKSIFRRAVGFKKARKVNKDLSLMCLRNEQTLVDFGYGQTSIEIIDSYRLAQANWKRKTIN